MRSSVFGWRCPWSGDETDPIPRRYWLWYQLYRRTRQAKHLIGWHDWRRSYVPDGSRHCDWCGAHQMERYPPHTHDEGDHDAYCPGCFAERTRR